MEPQKREAEKAQLEGVRTTENAGDEEESSHSVWRETAVFLDLREPPKMPATQSESRKEEFAGTTESASI